MDKNIYSHLKSNVRYLGENLSTGHHRWEFKTDIKTFYQEGLDWLIFETKRKSIWNAVQRLHGVIRCAGLRQNALRDAILSLPETKTE